MRKGAKGVKGVEVSNCNTTKNFLVEIIHFQGTSLFINIFHKKY